VVVFVSVTVSGSCTPAETLPVAGAPATLDWQLVSEPLKL
jgi:hypothetical protein